MLYIISCFCGVVKHRDATFHSFTHILNFFTSFLWQFGFNINLMIFTRAFLNYKGNVI
ncbi:hypothetical protein SFyv_5725 [Shigella flexneri Shi06HN006]|uniref:Uncharacterized protein n=1 Tax=Shigella flexneri 2a str. 301 TaxID=198214 RepID=A0AB36PLJ8_SHIFL|nr:hypothetical protein SFy_5662 [Shigella flexneri 2003036]AIL43247.1 hypothetical protein SFyv_5725 [Shigella flexneri Shi06HN006]EGJ82906.1 hypothetical protein SF274771_4252 [Shigella flexneri 2747-71]EGJ94813.1 hypothetical protein SF293071_4136 [Shigella flexneri 2930-71]EIQ04699.1 hypothetical protein SFK1770_4696 [Shigella flexneri K-1770]EJL11279.1 hypothetical protein SF660363_4075 [Shigella flexneri 6603-63]OXB30079.1 hypothetical protein SF301_2276 [Shigella flexneri 2a str. 301]